MGSNTNGTYLTTPWRMRHTKMAASSDTVGWLPSHHLSLRGAQLHASKAEPVRIAQQRIRRHVHNRDVPAFFNLLTGYELLGEVESLVPPHRARLFPPTETLSMFLAQALSADRSCQKVINDTAVTCVAIGLPPCSTHTGAYCRARQRVPLELLSTLVRQTGQRITTQAPESWRWRGRPVRLVDGTTVELPDTPANQAAHPQPRSQKPGLGAGSWACCVSKAAQCSMRRLAAIRERAVMTDPAALDTRHIGARGPAGRRRLLRHLFSAVQVARTGH